MRPRFLKALSATVLTAISSAAFAQGYNSTQAHDSDVTALYTCETYMTNDSSFYSAGKDGFIIKWGQDGMGEHYQVSDLQILKVVRNPANGDIAVYETDGISTHRVSVIDSRTFSKRYTKRFRDSVSALNFSEKGNYLIIGTASVNGTYIFNARTGTVTKRAGDVSGIITYARTGESEKTAIFYSPTGSIIYYDMTAFKQKASFFTEGMLEQVMLFGAGNLKNRFLAGVKNNTIYIVDATNGKIIAQYAAREPLIMASRSQYEDGLYYITSNGRNFSMRTVTDDMLIKQLGAQAGKSTAPQEPLIVKNFTGLRSRDSFTCAAKNSSGVILGTQSGNIYTMSSTPESETYTIFPITEKMYERIYDISADNENFYLLTADSIYRSSYDSRAVTLVAHNSGQTNLIKLSDRIILWSKGTRKIVQSVSADGSGTVTLFTPVQSLQNLRVFGDSIIYIQGNSSVSLYDMRTGTNSELYSGTSIQDAVLLDEDTLYVAKTSSGAGDATLVSVSITTRETVPVKIPGNVAFSLSYDYNSPGSPVYGILIRAQNGSNVTEVFGYNPVSRNISTLLRLTDEDSDAFTSLHFPRVYTNLGKNQIYACNVETKKNMVYERSASMPMKMEASGSKIAILNRNGSISWYSQNVKGSLADWYLTVNGEWFEF